jgi:hypothetical protein
MRQQMIGLEKEKALVEAREGLHFTPDVERYRFGPVVATREKVGMPIGGMGRSPLARSWENVTDSALGIDNAGDIRSEVANNPWLAKVPPETKVYSARSMLPDQTGFDHLVDELRNAINPESGLPKNLLIDPADLGKLTMPQAVDRVADINAWRATQKIEANQLLANNAATQLVKEYPGQGLKWVELRQPEGEFAGMFENPGYDMLQDALKYEGDTMQHCVGGYCPDVAEGRSRIYSLRDDKGQPRVTIEVKPMPQRDLNMSGEQYDELLEKYTAAVGRGEVDPNKFDPKSWYLAQGETRPPRITQIKGFRNNKPADEYLPFVQDFVKSGNWSDVRDLKNSGMIDIQKSAVLWPENTTGGQVDALLGGGTNGTKTPKYKLSDFYKLAEQDLGSRYVTEQDYQGWLTKQLDFITPTEGMAHGGLVSTNFDPIRIKQIIAGLDDEYDAERIQQIVAQRESAYA